MKRFYNLETFPILNIFNVEEIKEELQNSEWYDWPEYNLWNKKGDDWKICPLFGFNAWRNDNKFPKLIGKLKTIPGLRTATFSRLGPGTTLKAHYGWASLSNFVLRCQLGIEIPTDGKSGVIVEKEIQNVEQDQWVIFDDSKLHSGFNHGSTDRVVLILDIERPKGVPLGQSKSKDPKDILQFIDAMKKL